VHGKKGRTLPQRAAGSKLLLDGSRERPGHAAKARDAAENLVSQAISDLLDKLVPLGKISVGEDMAAAAEEYYAKWTVPFFWRGKRRAAPSTATPGAGRYCPLELFS